jgi:hypothetical protein
MRRLYVLLASVATATLLIVAATAAPAAPAQHQGVKRPPGLYYGALYVSSSTLTSYWGGSARTQSQALTQARNACARAANDCRRGVWVHNGFVSFASSANGAWATAWGSTAPLAESTALTACGSVGGTACSVTRTNRTLRYNPNIQTTGGP